MGVQGLVGRLSEFQREVFRVLNPSVRGSSIQALFQGSSSCMRCPLNDRFEIFCHHPGLGHQAIDDVGG